MTTYSEDSTKKNRKIYIIGACVLAAVGAVLLYVGLDYKHKLFFYKEGENKNSEDKKTGDVTEKNNENKKEISSKINLVYKPSNPLESIKSVNVKNFVNDLLTTYMKVFTVNKYFNLANLSNIYVFKTKAKYEDKTYDLRNIDEDFLKVMNQNSVEEIAESKNFTKDETEELRNIINILTERIRYFFALESKLFVVINQNIRNAAKNIKNSDDLETLNNTGLIIDIEKDFINQSQITKVSELKKVYYKIIGEYISLFTPENNRKTMLEEFKNMYQTATWDNKDEKDLPENEKEEYIYFQITPTITNTNKNIFLQDSFKPVKDNLVKKFDEYFKSEENAKITNKIYISDTNLFKKFEADFYNDVAAVKNDFVEPESFRKDKQKTLILEHNFYSFLFNYLVENKKISMSDVNELIKLTPVYMIIQNQDD